MEYILKHKDNEIQVYTERPPPGTTGEPFGAPLEGVIFKRPNGGLERPLQSMRSVVPHVSLFRAFRSNDLPALVDDLINTVFGLPVDLRHLEVRRFRVQPNAVGMANGDLYYVVLVGDVRVPGRLVRDSNKQWFTEPVDRLGYVLPRFPGRHPIELLNRNFVPSNNWREYPTYVEEEVKAEPKGEPKVDRVITGSVKIGLDSTATPTPSVKNTVAARRLAFLNRLLEKSDTDQLSNQIVWTRKHCDKFVAENRNHMFQLTVRMNATTLSVYSKASGGYGIPLLEISTIAQEKGEADVVRRLWAIAVKRDKLFETLIGELS